MTNKVNGVDRRKAIKIVGTGGLIGVAGCLGGDDADDDEENGDGGTPEEGERYGGHLEIAVEESWNTLNPQEQASAVEFIPTRWMYSNLVGIDSNLELYPDLADDWEPNDDASEFVFTLREDATFHHNDEQVVADDVKATFEHSTTEGLSSSGRTAAAMFDTIDVIDDQTVRFNLTEPFPDYPFSTARPHFRVMPKEIIEDDFDSLSNNEYGSGPFELDEFVPDERIELSRYDNYHLEHEGNDLPYLDSITIRAIQELTPRVSELTNGDVNIDQAFHTTAIEQIENEDNLLIDEVPGGWFYPIIMDTTVEPFDDRRVRHAIKYAVDRHAQLQGSRDGLGELGQDHPICPVHPFHEQLPEKFGPESKIDEAQELLEDAGYSDGITIEHELLTPAGHHAEIGPVSEIFHSNMEDAGIELTIENVSWDRFLSEVETEAPFYVSSYSLRPMEIEILVDLLDQDGPFYGTNWHEGEPEAYTEFENLMDIVSSEPDPDVRQEHFIEIAEVVRDTAGVIVPYFKSMITAHRDHVQNYQSDPTGNKLVLQDTWTDS